MGVNTLAAVLAEEPDAIEEIYEPFLMQIGFLNRTPRGRVATHLAYEHFKIAPSAPAEFAVLNSHLLAAGKEKGDSTWRSGQSHGASSYCILLARQA